MADFDEMASDLDNPGAFPGKDVVGEASLRHLLGRLGLVEGRVRAAVDRQREERGEDSSRSYYASHAHVDTILAGLTATAPTPMEGAVVRRAAAIEAQAQTAEGLGADIRFRRLARAMDLTPLDQELLLVAAAPSIDQKFEALYAHLNDDRTRRFVTVGLALAMCGVDAVSAEARARLGPDGPLVRGGLVVVEEANRTFVSTGVRVPDRVVAHLLGSDVPDPLVEPLQVEALPVASPTSRRLHWLLQAGASVAYVRDAEGLGGGSAAAAALVAHGRDVVMLDLERLEEGQNIAAVASAASREALLRNAGLVLGPIEVLADRSPAAVRAFTELAALVVLVGRGAWDPLWSRRATPTVTTERMDADEHERVWVEALGAAEAEATQVVPATVSYRLTPQQIDRAAHAARQLAAAENRSLTTLDVHRGIRAQNAAGLQRLARRIEPRVTWDDIILPNRVETQLRELPMRWRHRDRVLEDWGMGRGVATGRGVSALFAGGSGTGKTLAAEVIAGDLGLDLYLVDLSTVVDKYIGETSKNLERIFDQADRVNGVLLFDEADALFGKRSAVNDSKDRHANVEVAFLLQRMETFDGVAILTTNLAANLDEAFLRRLDSIVDFPTPNEDQRRAMWKAKLGRGVPCAGDVDVDELAALFTLSGSEIANIVVSAAYHAVDRGGEVTMRDLVEATVREHRKVGRHLTAADLGPHAHVLKAGA